MFRCNEILCDRHSIFLPRACVPELIIRQFSLGGARFLSLHLLVLKPCLVGYGTLKIDRSSAINSSGNFHFSFRASCSFFTAPSVLFEKYRVVRCLIRSITVWNIFRGKNVKKSFNGKIKKKLLRSTSNRRKLLLPLSLLLFCKPY